MILAAIFSPHKPRFNEVAVHMSTSALCVVGCGASSSADDSSNHLLANEPARIYSSIMLHFFMTVWHHSRCGGDQPLKDTQDSVDFLTPLCSLRLIAAVILPAAARTGEA